MIPRLSWPRRRRNTPETSPESVAEPLPPVPPPPSAPCWVHRPPEPFEPAERCGHCGEDIPESSVDGEYCSPKCAAAWLAANTDAITRFIGPVPIKTDPAPEPVEPPWLAAFTAWERKKADLVIEARKSPGGKAA